MNKLSFKTLREANTARLPLFKNAKGETQHSGSDWSLTDWMTALAGEVGEAANLIKKFRRGDYEPGDHEFYNLLASELADVQIYLDLLARDAGIDLGEAVVSKFNRKSTELELPVLIFQDGSGWSRMEVSDLMKLYIDNATGNNAKPHTVKLPDDVQTVRVPELDAVRNLADNIYEFKPETQVAGDRLLVSLPKPKEECRSEGIVDNAMVVFVNDTLAFHYEIPDPGKGYVWHRSIKNLPASELTGFTNVYKHYWGYLKEWEFRHLRHGKFLIVELPHADSEVKEYVDSDDDLLDISYAEFSGEIQLGKNERVKRTVIEPMDENYDIMNAAGLLTFGCDFTDFVIFEIY